MIHYQKTAEEIIATMTFDYAGQPECTHLNHAKHYRELCKRACAQGALNDALFMRYTLAYLACFRDANLSITPPPTSTYRVTTCGFSVRRYRDELLVTHVSHEDRLGIGEAIICLDDLSVDAFICTLGGNTVNGSNPERQLWDDTLTWCRTITVRHSNGHEERIALRHLPSPSFPSTLQAPTITYVHQGGPCRNEQTVLITAHHFANDSLLKAMTASFDKLQCAQRVIIDVRDAKEGVIGNAFCLLSLFFNQEVNLSKLMGEQLVYSHYTMNNALFRAQQLMRLIDACDYAGKQHLQAELKQVASCAGTGYVAEAEYEENILIPPAPAGQKVFLLSDIFTQGPAEHLAAIAQRASVMGVGKVCRVGRATRGSCEYSHLLEKPLEGGFSLIYPMSKSQAAYDQSACVGTGVLPTIYLPFTPDQSTNDVILQSALFKLP